MMGANSVIGAPPRPIARFAGTAREVGRAVGRALGPRLEENVARYLRERPQPSEQVDLKEFRRAAVPWLRTLPDRFQDELEGLAEGAQVPLQRVAEWNYLDSYLGGGCSGLVGMLDGHVWVARNNDMYVPGIWGHAIVHEVNGRIPTLAFGQEGDVFTATGINRDQLWLHHQALATTDRPRPGRPRMPGWVLLTDMLETCSSIADVEARLDEVDRDEGMTLFVVDGQRDEFAIFECSSSRYVRRRPTQQWMVATNHACVLDAPSPIGDSLTRQERMEEAATGLYQGTSRPQLPLDLIAMLADERVERRGAALSTVYAAVACPHDGRVWFTFEGWPAASKGNWQEIDWSD
jgi:hypothetical protein